MSLIGGNRDHEVLNVVLLHESCVFGRHLFVHECSEMVSATCNPKGAAYSAGAGCGQYCLELPALQKLEIIPLWVATAVHCFPYHGSVIGGRNFGGETFRRA
jgi:hypothetical protein